MPRWTGVMLYLENVPLQNNTKGLSIVHKIHLHVFVSLGNFI